MEGIDPEKTVSTFVIVPPPSHEFGEWVRSAILYTPHKMTFCGDDASLNRLTLLQRRIAAGALLCEIHLGDRDQNLGARLEIGRLEHRLLFRRGLRRHHRQR